MWDWRASITMSSLARNRLESTRCEIRRPPSMRQTYVGSSQREGSARPLPHREITRSQVLVEESVERGSRSGGKSRIASVLPRLIQELVLLGQMALHQDDIVTACSLLEASARLAKLVGEGQDCAEPSLCSHGWPIYRGTIKEPISSHGSIRWIPGKVLMRR